MGPASNAPVLLSYTAKAKLTASTNWVEPTAPLESDGSVTGVYGLPTPKPSKLSCAVGAEVVVVLDCKEAKSVLVVEGPAGTGMGWTRIEPVPPLEIEGISRKFPETAKLDPLKAGCGFAVPLWANDDEKAAMRKETKPSRSTTYLVLAFIVHSFAEAGSADVVAAASSWFITSGSNARKITRKFNANDRG